MQASTVTDLAVRRWAAVRPFLNIASSDVRNRGVAYSVLALASLVIFLFGPRFGSALEVIFGWVPFAAVFWVARKEVEAAMVRAVDGHPGILLAVCLAIWASVVVMRNPTAADDLLRDLAVSAYGYNYHAMFVASSIPPQSMYPLFDHAVGIIAGAIGMYWAMHVVQILAFLAVFAPFLALLCRNLPASNTRGVVLAFCMAIGFSCALGRVALGRPEVFLTGWVLCALLVRSAWQVGLWVVAGMLLSMCHIFAPVYFASAALLRVRRHWIVLAVVALLSFHVGFWEWYSHGMVMQWLDLGAAAVRNRQGQIQENMTIGLAFLQWSTLVTVATVVWIFGLGRPKRGYEILAVAGWFLLSGQIRFASVVVLLLVLFVSETIPSDIPLLRAARWRVLLWGYAAVTLISTGWHLIPYDSLPAMALPAGSRVLTTMGGNYAVLFHNAGRVRVAPALELGATDAVVQRLSINMQEKGTLDCGPLEHFRFNVVVEDSLRMIPPCLTPLAVSGPWRAWRVTSAPGLVPGRPAAPARQPEWRDGHA